MTIRARAIEVDAATAYRLISAFVSYPQCADIGPDVVVCAVEPGSGVSEWTLGLSKGLLHWTERDTCDPQSRTIRFTQLTGDFAVFTGSWTFAETAEHTVVDFDAVFDLGIPALAELLDPVIESALRNVVRLILTTLLGPVTEPEAAELTSS